MNITDIYNYLKPIYLEKYKASCSDYDLILTDLDMALAKVYYWLRNKKFGINGASDLQIYCGPKGHITQTCTSKIRHWFPHPDEYCGKQSPYTNEGKFHPYALANHCRTKDHIKYLVKYKKNSLIHRSDGGILSNLLFIMNTPYEDLPLIINTFDTKLVGKVENYYKMLISDRLNNICQMED